MAYDPQVFPYSSHTETMAHSWPSWTKIYQDRNSIGQQFLNAAAGLPLDAIEVAVGEVLASQFAGTVDLATIDLLYKTDISSFGLKQGSSLEVTGITGETIDGDGNITITASEVLTECDALYKFYSAAKVGNEQPSVFILDLKNNQIFTRKAYKRLGINGTSADDLTYSMQLHHVWNAFDEMALARGLGRRVGETNEELKARILNTFRYPANSSRLGLVHSIGRQLGLVAEEAWSKSSASYTTTLGNVYQGTVRVNGELVDELAVTYAETKATVYPKKDFLRYKEEGWEFDGVKVVLDEQAKPCLVLEEGLTEGMVLTPLREVCIPPSELRDSPQAWTWDKFYCTSTGDVSYDILTHSGYAIKGLASGDAVQVPGATPTSIWDAVRVRIYLSRETTGDASPVVSQVYLTHTAIDCTVTYIHDVTINALYKDDYKSTLFGADHLPSASLQGMADELNERVPILWGKWKWDEAYWDVVGQDLMGLDVLPNCHDPSLVAIANDYLQVGIGDGIDLLLDQPDTNWKLRVHSGHYYIGTGLEEHYLFANPVELTGQDSQDKVILLAGANPPVGSPIVVTKADGSPLVQVAFLDAQGEYSATNTETLLCQEAGILYTTYGDLLSSSISVDGVAGVTLDSNVASGNKLDGDFVAGTSYVVHYSVEDSFVVEEDASGLKLLFAEDQTGLVITYEGGTASQYGDSSVMVSGFYTETGLSFDPTANHESKGFVFLTSTPSTLDHLACSVTPEVIRGNGTDLALIHVDAYDLWGNPLPIGTVTCEVTDASGNAVEDQGTVIQVSTPASSNRATFRYNSFAYDTPEEQQLDTTVFFKVTAGTLVVGGLTLVLTADLIPPELPPYTGGEGSTTTPSGGPGDTGDPETPPEGGTGVTTFTWDTSKWDSGDVWGV